MKIAFFCSSEAWGGLEMNLYRLAVRLKARGHEIKVFAFPGSSFFQQAQKSGLSPVALRVKRHYTDFRSAARLARLLKQEEYKVLLFSIAKDNYIAGWAKIFFYRQLHIIYIQQMILGIPKKSLIQTFLYRNLSAWVSPSHVLATQVTQQTHMPVDRIHIVPLGIETETFSNHTIGKAEARRRLELPKNVFMAGTVGRLDPSKGQDVLIKAIGLLKQKNIKIHALFVGKETFGDTRKYPQSLKELSIQLQVETQIHFRDFTSEPALAFTALDVFVMSSHAEAFGMVTVEAMASGLPVIGTQTGGTPEILEEGNLGLLFPPNDHKNLAEALEKIYLDADLRKTLGVKARQSAIQKYSYQAQCTLLENVISKILQEN
ncbi:glycosyltransferase family 4 protein [Rhodocytophaga rosea]|uniref:Glycosyltransferase family 4 protein n=1 Tax=Rhodocytophaga rosea TaxID=2704465 RepID=A0A6C0GPD6_9BACT|nr:glycosyltransferase family 4 protein [Rhodocytophaga rosea]QHT69891.1 glycosyltransferase family 4 protein [Rhodocytophaga rosea]